MKSHQRFSYNKISFIAVIGLIAAATLSSSFASATANSGITYHGRILKPDGKPLTGSNVQFKVQFRTPGSEDCLMYEEVQTKDMSNSDGLFSLTINDGTGSRTDSTGYTIDTIFANRGSFSLASTTCQSGSGSQVTYTPNSADGRLMAVYFKDETMSDWEPTQSQMLNFVPLAIEAKQVGGFTASNLLRFQESDGTLDSVSPLNNAQYTALVALVNGTSGLYMKASSSGGASVPVLASVPSSPSSGTMWFDSSAHTLKFYDGTATQTVGVSGGSVTSITAGAGLSGGTITTSGTIALSASGVSAGTYPKVTVDTYGRVTGGSTLSEADIPTISTGGKVSGAALTSGTIGGSTAFNTSGLIQTSSTIQGATITATTGLVSPSVQVSETSGGYHVTLVAPSGMSSNYQLTLPTSAGSSGQVLATDGTGALNWTTITGVTPGGTASGDLSGSYPSPVVAKIQGVAVSATAPASGQIMSYNGSQWQPTNFSIADLKTSIGGNQFQAANCSANQTITWSSLTDSFTCSNIAISNTQVAGLGGAALLSVGTTSGTVAAGNDSRIVGAIQNSGGISVMQAGSDASIPVAGVAGKIYIATDTSKIYRDNGASWDLIASATGTGGTVTSVTAGTGLSGGTFTTSGTISLPNVGAAGTYTKVTTDAQGRVTGGASLVASDIPALDFSKITTGLPTTLSGYGITDSVQNVSGATGLAVGLDAGKPSAGHSGHIYLASDTSKIYIDDGSNWNVVASNPTSVTTATNFTGSLVGDVTGTQGATVVATVGGATAANVASATALANAATNANTASTIVKRDPSGAFSAGNITVGDISASNVSGAKFTATQVTSGKQIFTDSGSNTATLQAPTAISTSYVLKLPTSLPGSSNQMLVTDTSGNLSWLPVTSGSVTSVSASAPLVSSGSTTPTLSIAKATSSTDGYLSQTDWSTFNNKLGTSLANGSIWVGNGSGVATAVAPSGDITLSNIGLFTVTQLQGVALSSTTPVDGQILQYVGANSKWQPANFNIGSLKTASGASQFSSAACSAGQTLTWSSVSDVFSCSTIAITDSQIAYGSQTKATFFAAPAASNGAPTYRSIASTDLPATGATGVVLNGGNSFGQAALIGTNDSYSLSLRTNGSSAITIDTAQKVGIGTTAPAAKLQIAAGTATVAPLMLTRGTNLTTPLAGAIEYDGTNLYYTDGTATRRTIASVNGSSSSTYTQDATFSGSGTGLAVTNNATVGGTLGVTGASTLTGATSVGSTLSVTGATTLSGVTNSGTEAITNTTASTSSSTGALVVSGGVGVAGNINSAGQITSSGTSTNYFMGNVGIGTTTPANLLEIQSPVGNETFRTKRYVGSNSWANTMRFYQARGTQASPTASVNGDTLVTFNLGGYDGSSFIDSANIAAVSNGTIATGSIPTDLTFSTGSSGAGSERMRITSAGNVGIGTTTPSSLFDVHKAFTASGLYEGSSLTLTTDNGNNSWYTGQITGYVAAGTSNSASNFPGGLEFKTKPADGLTATVPTTKMVIDAAGNVGIGTTAPATALETVGAIHVHDASTIPDNGYNGVIRLTRPATGAGQFINFVRSGNNVVSEGYLPGSSTFGWGNGQATDSSFSPNYMAIALATGYIGIGTTAPSTALQVAGTVTATTFTGTSFVYSSDRRLKKDIRPIEGAREKVKQLVGVYFNWIKTGATDLGFIAQEVEKIEPNLVVTKEDGFKAVKYGNMVALLVQAYKEQDAIIEDQAQQIQALKAEQDKTRADLDQVMKRLSSLENQHPQ